MLYAAIDIHKRTSDPLTITARRRLCSSYGVPAPYAIPARTLETRARTSSTLSVTIWCMDSSTSKA